MAGWRQAVALAMTGEEIEALTALSRSRKFGQRDRWLSGLAAPTLECSDVRLGW